MYENLWDQFLWEHVILIAVVLSVATSCFLERQNAPRLIFIDDGPPERRADSR